ncbi:MAG TPA: lysophospholipid acyltransferase family protein [Hansschlegelia sp.]
MEAETAPRRAGRVVLWRSMAFTVAMALHICLTAVVSGPAVLLMSRRQALRIGKWWARSTLALLGWMVGTRLEIRGRHNIPQGAAIVAVKHQSALETFALTPELPDPAFVLKRELTWIPFFGWFLKRLDMIALNRAAGGEALLQLIEQANRAVQAGRQIVIFPEGTRRPIGAPAQYKSGVVHLYDRLNIPCVPVAINTGVFWPRRAARLRQGVAVIEFLEPIAPGLGRAAFERAMRERIETASDALAAEALGLAPPAPVQRTAAAQAR